MLGICQKVVDEGYTITLPDHNAPVLLLKVVLGGVGWVGGGAKMVSFPRISGFPPVRVAWGLGREKEGSPSDFIPPSIDAIKSFLRATKHKRTTLLHNKQSVTVCFHHSPAILARIWKRGFLIPHSCSFYTKIPNPELLSSLSRGLFSFSIRIRA